MRRSMSLALICAGLAACCGLQTAKAADVPGIYPQYQPAGKVTEFASGWYLRGDAGWRSDLKFGDVFSPAPIPPGITIDNIATGGGGGGYKSGWFRADVTVDYGGKARFSTAGTPAGSYDAKIDTWTILGNVYLDFGTWGGLTPYIGAGAGAVTFRVSDYAPPVGPVMSASQNRTAFAWAYMAGIAYAFAPRWLVDLSYRRVNYGDVTLNPNVANSMTLHDLTANEFRVGLRYNFD